MAEQYVAITLSEELAGYASERPLAEPAMAISPRHDEIGGERLRLTDYLRTAGRALSKQILYWAFAPRAVHRIIVFTEQFWICMPRFSAENRLCSFALTVPC